MFMGLISVACMFYTFFYNTKLFFYIKKTYPFRWEEVTTINRFGPGCSNPLRWFRYVFNHKETDDLVVHKLKTKVILGLKYSIPMFAGFVIEILLLFIVHR